MIEATILSYLQSQHITGIGDNIWMNVPENPPDEYLIIQKTGSGRDNRIDRCMIAIQSISRTNMYTAASLNETVKSLMLAMADNSNAIYRCELNSDYNFTNTDSKEFRYQAVFNLFY